MNYLILLIFTFYTFISTKFEQLFLLNTKKNISNFINKGYEFINLKKKYNINNFVEQIIVINQYFHKKIIKKNLLEKLIKIILLENNLSNYITKITGYNYSVDFILAYSTFYIEKKNQNKSIYANLWHRDKPFSKNTLKLIIPINNIQKNSGPMQIINKIISSNYNDFTVNKIIHNKYTEVVGGSKTIFLFNPNLCFHRAGIPNKGVIRSQLMIQLNPSKHWQYSCNLYKKQFKIEPKFPLFNIFDKKIKIYE
jgi:hypothetical protein